jgi:hypothetical protein
LDHCFLEAGWRVFEGRFVPSTVRVVVGWRQFAFGVIQFAELDSRVDHHLLLNHPEKSEEGGSLAE